MITIILIYNSHTQARLFRAPRLDLFKTDFEKNVISCLSIFLCDDQFG